MAIMVFIFVNENHTVQQDFGCSVSNQY